LEISTPPSVVLNTSRQQLNKRGLEPHSRQIDIINKYMALLPTEQQQDIFFSRTNRAFSSIDHMLGHKSSLNKVKDEIIQCIFPFAMK
jgi:hypothetical protein